MHESLRWHHYGDGYIHGDNIYTGTLQREKHNKTADCRDTAQEGKTERKSDCVTWRVLEGLWIVGRYSPTRAGTLTKSKFLRFISEVCSTTTCSNSNWALRRSGGTHFQHFLTSGHPLKLKWRSSACDCCR